MARVSCVSLPVGIIVDTDGTPVPGAVVWVYEHNTTTPVVIYTDETGISTLTQPLTTDINGRIPGYLDEDQITDFAPVVSGVASHTTMANVFRAPLTVPSDVVSAYDAVHDRYVAVDADVFTALEKMKTWLLRDVADEFRERIPNGMRRALQLRRPWDATRLTGGVDVFGSDSVTISDATGAEPVDDSDDQSISAVDRRLNTTAAGLALVALCKYAQTVPQSRRELEGPIESLARKLLAYQYGAPTTLRRGGFKLSAETGDASAFNAAVCGRGMLLAYEVTGVLGFLTSAFNAADFLIRLSDPNTYWSTTYGVTPINRTVNSVTWRGFCDKVSASDKLTTTSTTWNLVAAAFLQEVGTFKGGSLGVPYLTVAAQARDFLAFGVTDLHNYFAVQTNVTTGALTAGIGTSDTTIAYALSGVPTALPAFPFDIQFQGETMTATATPGAGQLTVTRSASPIAHSSGAMFQAVMPYVTAQWPNGLSHMYNDHAWHRNGDVAGTGTVGNDSMEYGLIALLELGYDAATIKAAYEHMRGLPHSGSLTVGGLPAAENSDGGAFGRGFTAAACFAGYFRIGTVGTDSRPDRHYGSFYDVQGAGTLLALKARFYPADYAVSLPLVTRVTDIGALADLNFDTIYSNAYAGTTFQAKLNGAVTSGATTITYTLTSGQPAFPTVYPFDLWFTTETMTATGSPGANQLTVTRGSRGTTPTAQADQSSIRKLETYTFATQGTIPIADAMIGVIDSIPWAA